MGTSACFNSFAFDARRVRVALDRGARLWQILVVKNLALMIVVFPLGVAMCLALAFLNGRPATLLASIALVLCILMLWSGVGNLLSVVLPLRDVPLKVHRQQGTLKQFLIEFAVTWGVSYLVLVLLIWRVYSAKGMGERYNSTLIGSGVAGGVVRDRLGEPDGDRGGVHEPAGGVPPAASGAGLAADDGGRRIVELG